MTTTLLFVPGGDRHKIDKSRSAGADVVILDLEDAVSDTHKDEARDITASELQRGGWASQVGVRVNRPTSAPFEVDIQATAQWSDWLITPKVEASSDVDHTLSVTARTGARVPRLIALLESARGILAAPEVAAEAGLAALMFGSGDYCADMGIKESKLRHELDHVRAHIALAAASRRLLAIDAPFYQDINDHAAVRADAQRARQFGYGAKAAIHPSHLAIIRRAFQPQPAEIEWARQILRTHNSTGGGAGRAGDTLVDGPVLIQAKAVLERADPPSDNANLPRDPQ